MIVATAHFGDGVPPAIERFTTTPRMIDLAMRWLAAMRSQPHTSDTEICVECDQCTTTMCAIDARSTLESLGKALCTACVSSVKTDIGTDDCDLDRAWTTATAAAPQVRWAPYRRSRDKAAMMLAVFPDGSMSEAFIVLEDFTYQALDMVEDWQSGTGFWRI